MKEVCVVIDLIVESYKRYILPCHTGVVPAAPYLAGGGFL